MSTLLSASLLDRLDSSHQPAKQSSLALSAYIKSIECDLVNLLNSPRLSPAIPASCGELAHSLLDYGVEDVTTLNVGNGAIGDQVCRDIERAIANHEPRLSNVSVSQENTRGELSFHFRIRAVVKAEPLSVKVVFDSVLEPAFSNFAIDKVQYE